MGKEPVPVGGKQGERQEGIRKRIALIDRNFVHEYF